MDSLYPNASLKSGLPLPLTKSHVTNGNEAAWAARPQAVSIHGVENSGVRFGFTNSPQNGSLPRWARKVNPPKTDVTSLAPIAKELEESVRQFRSGENPTNILGKVQVHALRFVRQISKIQKELLEGGLEYLPDATRDQALNYRHSLRYQLGRLFMPAQTKRKLIILQGPIAIKRAQEDYQFSERILNMMSAQIESFKKAENLKFPYRLRRLQTLLLFQLIRLKLRWDIHVLKPLGNRVPGLSKEMMREPLEKLIKLYNQKNGKDSLAFDGISRKPIASGSMGQVFLATTAKGKKLIVKVQRHTPDAIRDYLPYAYFCKLVYTGPKQARISAVEAEKQIRMLQAEADARTEQNNAQRVASEIKRLKLSHLEAPLPAVASQGGLVMEFVGDKDLSQLGDEQKRQTLKTIVPQLLTMRICSPEKMGDLYFSNIRVDSGKPEKAYLIDHGRTFSMNRDTHRKLLRIVTLALASPFPQARWGQDPEIRQACYDLFGVNPDQLIAQQSWFRRTLFRVSGRQAALDRQVGSGVQVFLDQLMKQHPMLTKINSFSKGKNIAARDQTFPGNERPFNILSFWSNYLILSSLSDYLPDNSLPQGASQVIDRLPPLLASNASIAPAVLDLISAQDKFRNTVAGFLTDGADLPEVQLRRWIEQETGLSGRQVRLSTLRQYRTLAQLNRFTGDIAEAMVNEAGLSGLSDRQMKTMRRRLNVGLYCDLSV